MGQHGHQGKQEGQSFSSARLCNPDHVLPGPNPRNGLSLDFRWVGNAHVIQGVQILSGYLELGERHEAK